MLVRMLLRRYVALAVVVSVFIAVPALAAPPAPEGGLALQSPDARTAGAYVPAYGDVISFDSWVDGKLAKNYWLTIRVDCRQGNQGVYMAARPADGSFLLQDQIPNGEWWDGGPAECTATLLYSTKRRATVVGYTYFSVGGMS